MRHLLTTAAVMTLAMSASAHAALIATDHFLTGGNAANGQYDATTNLNQFRRSTANGAGQNPTIAGFSGAWTGNVTSGTLAVAQWTAETTGIPSLQGVAYQAGGRARFGGASATNTLPRRVQRTLSSYVPSNTYYMSMSSQIAAGDLADTTTPGFVGIGFSGAGTGNGDDAYYAGANFKGVLVGAYNDNPNIDYVVRHVAAGSLQNTVIEDNIVMSSPTPPNPPIRFTVVRIDFDDEPSNPAGNSKLTIWHNPTLESLASEASATSAAAPLVVRTSALGTNADMTQLTMYGLNWSVAASFDEPRLATTWEAVIPIPEPATIGAISLAGVAALRRRPRRDR